MILPSHAGRAARVCAWDESASVRPHGRTFGCCPRCAALSSARFRSPPLASLPTARALLSQAAAGSSEAPLPSPSPAAPAPSASKGSPSKSSSHFVSLGSMRSLTDGAEAAPPAAGAAAPMPSSDSSPSSSPHSDDSPHRGSAASESALSPISERSSSSKASSSPPSDAKSSASETPLGRRCVVCCARWLLPDGICARLGDERLGRCHYRLGRPGRVEQLLP